MRQTELEQRLERVQQPSAPISTPVTPIELPQVPIISQEDDIVDTSQNLSRSQPIERQSIKRESSVGDEDNNRKRRVRKKTYGGGFKPKKPLEN